MKKFISVLLVLSLSSPCYAATGWSKSKPADTDVISDVDDRIGENNAALDLALAGYRQGAVVSYLSAATLTVGIGSVVVSNSTGAIRLMLRNTSATTVTWANIDAGAEAVSTTYYVYAVASAVTDTVFTVVISTSATSPTGYTYYKLLGSFYNNSSGNITLINNEDDNKEFGDWSEKTINTAYQATTDGFATATIITPASAQDAEVLIYSDAASNPTTIRAAAAVSYGTGNGGGFYNSYNSATIPVKKGDYYKATATGGYSSAFIFWVPLQ